MIFAFIKIKKSLRGSPNPPHSQFVFFCINFASLLYLDDHLLGKSKSSYCQRNALFLLLLFGFYYLEQFLHISSPHQLTLLTVPCALHFV